MSQIAIINNIKRLLKERNWNVSQLEKKVGSTRAVNNILRGSSKNPSIDVIYSIAKAFNVNIYELIIEQPNFTPINIPLFEDICSKVLTKIKELPPEINITHDNLLSLIKEAYEYSEKLNINNADSNFIDWMISQRYK